MNDHACEGACEVSRIQEYVCVIFEDSRLFFSHYACDCSLLYKNVSVCLLCVRVRACMRVRMPPHMCLWAAHVLSVVCVCVCVCV